MANKLSENRPSKYEEIQSRWHPEEHSQRPCRDPATIRTAPCADADHLETRSERIGQSKNRKPDASSKAREA